MLPISFVSQPAGSHKDFTFRAWDALKLFRVDALLIDHAHFLTENALSTLIAMSQRSEYRIPAILIGSIDLDAWLKKAGKLDYFKPFYRFKNLSSEEFAGVIKAFERQFLELPTSVDLKQFPGKMRSVRERRLQNAPLYCTPRSPG